MIKFDEKTIENCEIQYPGIREQIFYFENATLPQCLHCDSTDTANVQIGIIGRTIHIAGATTKFHLISNGPKPGKYFCNECGQYFNESISG